MPSRNISFSKEAYASLAALKGPRESFTEVIDRLSGKRSILDLAGVLVERKGAELRSRIRDLRTKSRRRLDDTTRMMGDLEESINR